MYILGISSLSLWKKGWNVNGMLLCLNGTGLGHWGLGSREQGHSLCLVTLHLCPGNICLWTPHALSKAETLPAGDGRQVDWSAPAVQPVASSALPVLLGGYIRLSFSPHSWDNEADKLKRRVTYFNIRNQTTFFELFLIWVFNTKCKIIFMHKAYSQR